jgi:hypothetical protein
MKTKKSLLVSLVLLLLNINLYAQIGIGTTTPAPSAALEVSSSGNNKGILIPRLSANQKDAISNPAEGLMIYQTSAPAGFYFYSGNSWILLVSQTDLDLKVAKVSGKDLSSNDYTSAEKTKLAGISGSNTGDQDLSALATVTSVALKANSADVNTAMALKANATDLTSGLATKVDKVIGKDLSSNDYTSAEKTKVSNLSGTNTGDQTTISGNAATATKLETARSINGVAFDGSADIIIAADAGTLSGSVAIANGGTGSTTKSFVDLTTLQTIAGDKTFSSDITVNGVKIGRGLNSIASNTEVGFDALKSNTTGANNIAAGYEALKANTAGYSNAAFGGSALTSNTTGFYNTALGKDALKTNISGSENTGVGLSSLYSNNGGSYNTAIGSSSLDENTSGEYNTAVGRQALSSTTSGSNNVAVGAAALNTNTTGSSNTAIGNTADVATNNLTNATAIGNGAIVSTSNTIQLGNTSVTNVKTSGTITAGAVTYPKIDGSNGQVLITNGAGEPTWITPSSVAVPYTGATQAVDLGAYNLTVNGVSVGRGSGDISITSNTAIGASALSKNTTGSNNTANGVYALVNNTTGSNNSAQGIFALELNTTGSNNTSNGMYALLSNTTGSYNTAIGNNANVATGALTNATAIGAGAIVNTSNTIQLGNTSVGNVKTSGTVTAGVLTYPNTDGNAGQVLSTNGSGVLTWQSSATSYTAGNGITFAGSQINVGNSTQGSESLALGIEAGKTSQGSNAVALGTGAGLTNQASTAIAIGSAAGRNNQSQGGIAIGYVAVDDGQGNHSVAIGSNAGQYGQGAQSVAVGYAAGQSMGDATDAVAIGAFSSANVSKGTALGAYSNAGFENSTAVGYGASTSAINSIQLGNASVTDVKTSGSITAKSIISSGRMVMSTATIDFSELNNYDVSNVSILFVKPDIAWTNIYGLKGGVTGQVIHIYAVNNQTLNCCTGFSIWNYDSIPNDGDQKFLAPGNFNIGSNRNTTLVFDGTYWRVTMLDRR